jgi:hypothetical protein
MHRVEHLEGRTLFASYAAANVTELIAAMNAANASAQADTITLAAGANFSLSTVHNRDNGPNGLPRITDRGGLTIIGGAATVERSAATGTLPFRLFDVAPRGSLTLRNLTLQGGQAASPDGLAASQGGAIYNAGTLALDGVTVQNNVARGPAGSNTGSTGPVPGGDANGGGVFSSGALTVTGSTFLNNQAVGGRGVDFLIIYMGGDSHRILPASGGGNGYGGGVYIAGGTASLSGSTFTGNVAAGGDKGSDYYADDGLRGGNGFGGGLFAAGRVDLRTVTATGNFARGGLGGLGDAPGDGIGGGIYIHDRARANLDDYTVSHVVQNTASTSSPNIAGPYRRLR